MATFKTVTFTEEEWVVLSLAFISRAHYLKHLLVTSDVAAARDGIRRRLADLEALIQRLEV